MTLTARLDKRCVDDEEFCILQLLTKKIAKYRTDRRHIVISVQQRLLCNNQSNHGLVVSFTMRPKHTTIF